MDAVYKTRGSKSSGLSMLSTLVLLYSTNSSKHTGQEYRIPVRVNRKALNRSAIICFPAEG